MSLVADSITAGYRGESVLHDATVSLHAGEVLGIIGPNGCGKSTLLRTMAGLLRPTRGSVRLGEQPIRSMSSRARARSLAVLPQTTVAPTGLTVADLVAFGRAPHRSGLQSALRAPDQHDHHTVQRALHEADLDGLADRPLSELSGGERQRAWVAMTLAQETPFMLLDEPTAALDIGHALELLALVAKQARSTRDGLTGKGVGIVLHDLNLAAAHCTRIVAMHDGRVLADGTPSEVLTAERVRTLYDVDATIEADEKTGSPRLRFSRREA